MLGSVERGERSAVAYLCDRTRLRLKYSSSILLCRPGVMECADDFEVSSSQLET